MLGLAESGGVVPSSTSLALLSAATALVGLWVWSQQKPRKDFPPGPKGWPLIGNILEFRSDIPPHIIFMEHAKKYGDIFSIRIGQRWTVVLNGAAVIKEALLKKGVEFANRPSSYSIDLASEGGKNIVFGQFTPTWKLHRKLAYSAFRTLATGNNERFEKLVYSILPGLTKHLESKSSEPFDPRTTLASCIYNILATMCFGKQFEFDGPEVKFWMRMSQQFMEIFGNGLAADYIPILKHIPTPAVKKSKEFTNEFYDAINKELEEHHASYDGGEPKDLIEMLFHIRQEMEDEGSEDMTMITETYIRQTVADVFGGMKATSYLILFMVPTIMENKGTSGTDTSIFTMHWSVGLLVQYPEVQAKVAAEVDRVVGRDRLPCLNDRDNLPYTTATLYEVMRYSSIAPVSVPHATSKEVQIGEFCSKSLQLLPPPWGRGKGHIKNKEMLRRCIV
ncbi:Cytochrome P450 1A1 [Holothuria leucospilota]|uniref:Cytochrome P450 1A1 n=1 Tax=Holothuria leucospilota TaxID=206669 RepID=A0A9Q1CKD7_HOLLE|nr:Cytochrome P450 1A1 [Holothuria leucospilota]